MAHTRRVRLAEPIRSTVPVLAEVAVLDEVMRHADGLMTARASPDVLDHEAHVRWVFDGSVKILHTPENIDGSSLLSSCFPSFQRRASASRCHPEPSWFRLDAFLLFPTAPPAEGGKDLVIPQIGFVQAGSPQPASPVAPSLATASASLAARRPCGSCARRVGRQPRLPHW